MATWLMANPTNECHLRKIIQLTFHICHFYSFLFSSTQWLQVRLGPLSTSIYKLKVSNWQILTYEYVTTGHCSLESSFMQLLTLVHFVILQNDKVDTTQLRSNLFMLIWLG
jgi:hypothetical protein